MMAFSKKMMGYAFLVASLALCAILAVIAAYLADRSPRTDDAFIQADIVNMAPEVSGRVIAINVRDNQFVHRGDTLFVIDPEPFRYAVEQAQADLDNLKAELPLQDLQIGSQKSTAEAQESSVEQMRAQLALAKSTEARLAPLARQGFVTAQELDQARSNVKTSSAALEQAIHSQVAALKSVRDDQPIRAQILGMTAKLQAAQRNLRLTDVKAPCDGQITGLNIAAGEYATEGKSLFTIIDTEHWWVVANFRETQVPDFHAGQPAIIHVLARPDVVVHGHVESLGGGVQPDVGSLSNGLPQVARSLNWVRIAQRYPVRISLDHPPAEFMRIGATVVATIQR
ncbi:efflux RND transporter periplasmic adaptor subunit [Acetobacter farinalis]|uniref:Efflux RND transporter periplasmic adaptor subunit n=1 Tax=Acetobacter farinalis TaxID=1260984 RepID=A0ABT3QA01_9PROT|nr:HlyD family efflux transporter periplasmic adaptor subunit [Acetobacter farinalis]MCX2562079.1 efflux RND transporter periplasmic adaptor subunit [Acetobacter farinalis]NHO30683.1 HlyD family efflux transporter periplasmic adaptor subunit [Acetobacter farinalis]